MQLLGLGNVLVMSSSEFPSLRGGRLLPALQGRGGPAPGAPAQQRVQQSDRSVLSCLYKPIDPGWHWQPGAIRITARTRSIGGA